MMMPPMQRSHGRDTGNAQPDHAIGGFGRKPVLHDQGRQTRDQQQGRDAAQHMRTVMMMPAMMQVVAMMTMPAVMAAPVAVVGAFVEREFVAHADIEFAHKSPCVCAAAIGRKENIIM